MPQRSGAWRSTAGQSAGFRRAGRARPAVIPSCVGHSSRRANLAKDELVIAERWPRNHPLQLKTYPPKEFEHLPGLGYLERISSEPIGPVVHDRHAPILFPVVGVPLGGVASPNDVGDQTAPHEIRNKGGGNGSAPESSGAVQPFDG